MAIKLSKFRIRHLSPSYQVGLLLLVFFFGTSCKTYQYVDWIKPVSAEREFNKYFEPRQLSRIQEGDSLLIKTKDFQTYELIYSLAKNDTIYGIFWQKNDSKFQIPVESSLPFSKVKELKVRKFNLRATIGLAVGVPLIGFLVYFFVSIDSLADSFDEQH